MNEELNYESQFSEFMLGCLVLQSWIEQMSKENNELKDKLRSQNIRINDPLFYKKPTHISAPIIVHHNWQERGEAQPTRISYY